MSRSRREIKLPYRELKVSCPYCKAQFLIGTVMDMILSARRTCPECARDFLVENDVPKRLAEKKPSKSVAAARTIKRAKLN